MQFITLDFVQRETELIAEIGSLSGLPYQRANKIEIQRFVVSSVYL